MVLRLYGTILVLGLTAGPSPARGQITIEYADWLRYVERGNHTAVSHFTSPQQSVGEALSRIVRNTGADQTWDLTTIPFMETSSQTYEVVERPFPGSDHPALSRANLVWKTTNDEMMAYLSYEQRPDSVVILGTYVQTEMDDSNAGPDEVISAALPAAAEYRFPLAFGDRWSRSQIDQTWINGQAHPYRNTIVTTRDIIGWGRLITHSGSEDALMEKVTIITSNEGPAVEMTTYQFLTRSWLTASVFVSPDGSYGSATYTVLEK